jgi:hypothetical protein
MHIPNELDTNTRLIIMGQAPIFVQLTHHRCQVTGTPAAVQVVGTVTPAGPGPYFKFNLKLRFWPADSECTFSHSVFCLPARR